MKTMIRADSRGLAEAASIRPLIEALRAAI